jgi:hypothetical protein
MLRARAGRCIFAAFEQGDPGELEGFTELVEQGRQWTAAAQRAAGQGGQRLGLGSGPGGDTGAPAGQVDGDRHRDRDRQEHGQREDVLPPGDAPVVDRGDEVPGEQQERDHRRGQCRV